MAQPDFRLLFESAPDHYLVLSPELTILAVSDAYARATRTKREELLGRLIFEVFPDNPVDPDATGARNLRASLERVRGSLATDVMPHASNSPILNARGELSYIIHRVEDVAAARAGVAARQAGEFLEAVIENIPHMVFVKDAERLAFVRMNRAGEELLGLPRSELIGKTDYDFFPREQAEFFQAKDRETLRSRALVDVGEEPLQTSRGLRVLRTKKVPILDATGEPSHLLGISEDVTELVRAKEAAEVANRELESFSYSVAHDLRAPLRSIDGFSQAVLEDCADKLDDEGRKHLGFVRESAQLMAQLIDSMLTLSRVGRQEVVRRTVDLSGLARAAWTRLERTASGRVVDVELQEGLAGEGDPRLLALVFDNLLGNALKFTANRANARVEFGTISMDGGPAYFVRDNGAGFDMTYAGKLFGAFQRLHGAHEFEGTGVGLATVQRVIHRHGGRVWADGKVDAGATFYFTLGEKERLG
jgi:PAS domain S-box-containing protein